jgi:diketogulonate reductase-like aldo/keto reductase
MSAAEDQAGGIERVDPSLVPSLTLANGATIPAIGMGTFGSDSVPAERIAAAVSEAAAMGYRHFDCAAVYGNESEIGAALKGLMVSGLKRQELFITSKLWNDRHDEGEVIPAFEASLRALGLDYLDLYLIHWPFPNHHAPGVDVSARAGNAQPYRHEAYMKVWRKLESLVDSGLVRSIGTSNMSVAKLELLLRDARIRPAVNELELHPHFQQPELCAYLSARGIQPIAYSPLGSPGRPERDRTPEDSVDIEDPVIRAIAARREEHPAAVCLRWAIQRGHVPIPFSASKRNLLANLKAAVSEALLPEDMAAIERIDRGCRLIKGQVFLWKEGQSWEDLWDMDGIIRS